MTIDEINRLAEKTPYSVAGIASRVQNSKRYGLPLDLQFFAEGGSTPPAGDPPGTPPGTDPPEGDPPAKVELTQKDLDKKIEAEADRKLTKALEKKQVEWQEQQKLAIQEALEEKERLSKLSEKERKEEELSTREKKLLERQAEIERKELKADAVTDLSEKGLPASFADFLLAENAEKTLENINKLKEVFDTAVNEAVKGKLRQDDPKTGSANKGTGTGGKSLSQLAQEKRLIK